MNEIEILQNVCEDYEIQILDCEDEIKKLQGYMANVIKERNQLRNNKHILISLIEEKMNIEIDRDLYREE